MRGHSGLDRIHEVNFHTRIYLVLFLPLWRVNRKGEATVEQSERTEKKGKSEGKRRERNNSPGRKKQSPTSIPNSNQREANKENKENNRGTIKFWQEGPSLGHCPGGAAALEGSER